MKKLRPRSKPCPSVVGLLDKALGACTNISTLAGLLGTCGNARPTDKLEVELVAAAGWMIFDEAQRLNRLLNEFGRKGPI